MKTKYTAMAGIIVVAAIFIGNGIGGIQGAQIAGGIAAITCTAIWFMIGCG